MLIDRYGRPLRAPTKDELTTEQAAPTLGSVRQIASGHPAEGLEPLRLAAILHSAETGDATAYLELAEQMEEKDLHYAAVLGVRKRAVRSLGLKVEPGAEDDTAAQEAADMVRDALSGPAVRTSLIGILDAVGKGFSVSEILWNTEGRRWTVEGIERVDPRWFEFDPVNGRHIRLRGAAGGEELRPWKYVVHFAEAKSGLPIRGGLARLAAWGFMFKHFTIRDWAIFTEAYGHPLRIGKYDPALASAQDKATLLRAVRSMGTDMAAIIPNNMLVDIITTAVSGTQELYERTARYWDEQISKGVLGQVATTDAIAGGHAVGKIHEEVRGDIRDADADDLAATLMRDVATPVTRLNFPEGTAVPVIRFEAGQTGMIRAVGGARGQIQNMSFQVADLATQIGAGTAASVAFGQQLPQMLGGLGAFGALAGAAVAIGVPLTSAFLGAGDAAKQAETSLKALDTALGRVADGIERVNDPRLGDTFGSMAGSVRDLSAAMLELDRAAELRALQQSLDKTFGQNLQLSTWQRLNQPLWGSGRQEYAAIMERGNYAQLTGGKGLSYDDFQTRRQEIDLLAKTGQVEEVAGKVQQLIRDMADGGPITDMNAALAETLTALGDVAIRTAELEAGYNGSADAAKAFNDLLSEATARQTELKRLTDVRADAEQRLADALSARDAAAATSARAVIAETERQIAATTDARVRIDALGTSLAEIEHVASTIAFDKDGKFRGALDLAKADLLAARKNVDDLNDAELSRLENAFHRIARAARDMAQATTGLGGGFGGMDLSGYADGLSATRAMIQKYEGWAPVAKWDENANRGGWGSSTVTLADGSQRTLQKGETVNKADADRDLDRRIRGYFEEQQRVAGAAWAGFNPAQVAALASIQHNYGSLPDRIRPALQTGDAQIIAQAIAGLAMDYTRSERDAGKTGRPMNYNRRMGEAAAFGDAIGVREANEATLAAGEEAAREAKRKSDELERQRKADEDRRAREVKARADQDSRMRDSVTAELDKLAPSYQRAVAAADRWKAEALAGLDKTKAGYDAFAADIEAIYQQRIAKAREDDLARQDAWSAGIERGFAELEESAVSWSDVSEDLVTGWAKGGEEAFVNFVKTGKAELEDLLDFTLEQLARLAWQQAIQPGLNGLLQSAAGALGGFLGGGAGVTLPTAHTGGTGVMRTYSAGNRQRADERLAMLRDGERVMTPRMLENAGALVSSLAGLAGGRGDQPVLDTRPVVQVINQSSTQVDGRVRETRDERGGRQYQLVLSDAVAGALTAPGGRASQTLRAQFGVTKKGTRR